MNTYESLPRVYNLAPANVNSSGYAAGVSGASWTLTATQPGDGLAHQVTIANQTANSHTGQTITIVGIDQNGQAATETITGPAGNATVTSTKYYGTVTSVTPSATFGADTVNIGWNNVIAFQTINVNYMAEDILSLLATVTGTINFTINQTFDKIDFTGTPAITPTWLAVASSQTSGGTVYQTTGGATAIQIIVNSYSSGATLKVNANATFVPIAAGGGATASNVNVTQLGGTAVATGNGTTNSGTQRVTISSDSTGQINVVPKAVAGNGATYTHIAAGQATTVIKASAGTLYAIVMNTKATSSSVTTVYDNPTGVGTVIGVVDGVNTVPGTSLNYGPAGVAFANGLTIIVATANGSDMTVIWK